MAAAVPLDVQVGVLPTAIEGAGSSSSGGGGGGGGSGEGGGGVTTPIPLWRLRCDVIREHAMRLYVASGRLTPTEAAAVRVCPRGLFQSDGRGSTPTAIDIEVRDDAHRSIYPDVAQGTGGRAVFELRGGGARAVVTAAGCRWENVPAVSLC